ncbi:MAG: TatD family hydrolase [Bacteroidia bacterium]|nr:TatD family hydrolase [Bacteroidia bacterium]
MNLPRPGDYIDIHTHGAKTAEGIFIIENLMAHEKRTPQDIPEQACTFGIHPWYLNDKNYNQLLNNVNSISGFPNLIAFGEAGFDKLRGPSTELQRRAFEKQIAISEENMKPVVIHCVRAWNEILEVHKKLRPEMLWMIHGFRGNVKLATQLLSKGMYLSFWFDFVIRPESAKLLRSLPKERIFLETDGADIDIRTIYKKVATDLDLSIDELKSIILTNFKRFYKL